MTYFSDEDVLAILPDVDTKNAPIGHTAWAQRPTQFTPHESIYMMEDGPHFPPEPLDFYTKTPDGWIKHEGRGL